MREMSSTTKRKFVANELLNEYILPDQTKEIVRVLGGKGNNLHSVRTADGQEFLASMPNKFRKNVYIKRGDYILVERIPEGGKVKAEVVHIPLKEQVKYIKSRGLWPEGFKTEEEKAAVKAEQEQKKAFVESGESEDDDDDDLFQNTNRKVIEYDESSSEEEEDE